MDRIEIGLELDWNWIGDKVGDKVGDLWKLPDLDWIVKGADTAEFELELTTMAFTCSCAIPTHSRDNEVLLLFLFCLL